MSEQRLSNDTVAHGNHDLFSDYYLDHVLPAMPEWDCLAESARPVMEAIARVFASFTPSRSEAQTEEELVRPVLRLLGHDFEVQPPLRVGLATQKPDYLLYRTAQAIATHKNQTLTRAVASEGAFAVGDAKYWERPLDSAVHGSDAFTNRSPSWQIWSYIDYSGVDWGMLTNGRKWRLYHKDTAREMDRFYEVDLKDAIESGDVRRFLYFFAFFRRDAFEDTILGVDQILHDSLRHALRISDSLRDQVYSAVRHLAQGFLDYTPNGLQPDTATLKTIYDNSLVLLYRLIFILYAEARGLLPVREPGSYRDTYSLQAIKEGIAANPLCLEPDSARIWPSLKDLCRCVNEGRRHLNVPTFNGGLFDPEKHPFLDGCVVGDRHLQRGIDMLARVDGEFVDYRELSVRHLGTIYEGLLEFRLRVIPPEGDWTIDLVNDKGERRATGSYYTPDHIVKYIVEQTVVPALSEAVAGKKSDRERIDAILRINVLDPAMGSGHFLVEATDQIARFLVNLGVTAEADDNCEGDLAYWKRRVVQCCVYGVDRNPLAVELAKLSLWLATVARDRPLSFLDHHLRPGNSLVGASLTVLQSNLPIPKGVRSQKNRDAVAADGQGSFDTIPGFTQSMCIAVQAMDRIESTRAETLADVKQQERWYSELRDALTRRFERLADLLTAVDFGLDVDSSHWRELVRYTTNGNGGVFPPFEAILGNADRIAKEQSFFHWEFEFPEVYFDEFGRHQGDAAGFEVVIGNPPYFNMQTAPVELRAYVEKAYAAYHRGKADVYYYFMALANRQGQRYGYWSYITARYFLESYYADRLWSQLQRESTIEHLIDFGGYMVFKDASVHTCIVRARRTGPAGPDHTFPMSRVLVRDLAPEELNALLSSDLPADLDPRRVVTTDVSVESLRRPEKPQQPLGSLCHVGKGAASGNDGVFVVNDSVVSAWHLEAELLCPVVEDDSIDRYYHRTAGRFLIATRRGCDIAQYAHAYRYLSSRRRELEERYAVQHEGVKWYEIVRYNTDVYDGVSPQIYVYYRSSRGKFSYSPENLCTLTTTFVVVPKRECAVSPLYLLSVLNSRYIQDHYFARFGKGMGSVIEFSSSRLKDVPIPAVDMARPDTSGLVEEASTTLAQDPGALRELILHQSSRGPLRTDVIHDLLVGLAEQMIDLTKARRDALDAFHLDLEGVLTRLQLRKLSAMWMPPRPMEGSSADANSNHSALLHDAQQYLGLLAEQRMGPDECISRVSEDAWRWLLVNRLRGVPNLSDLVAIYRKHHSTIADLESRIAVSDDVIDGLVESLYTATSHPPG